jgi:hypothetical protein
MSDPVRDFADALIAHNVATRFAARSVQGNSYGKPLYGHKDENSAYLVEDYPYGARARCRIRYWLESSSSKGYRFVAQTEDPKKLRWNNPKKSTYTEWGGAMYLDHQDHVQWVGVGQYTNDEKMLEFVKAFPDSDMSILKKVVPAKMKYLLMRISGSSGMTMNGQKVEMSEEDIGRSRQELEIWKDIAKYVH